MGLLLFNSCNKNERFVVKGTIENAVADKIFFTRMDVSGDVLIDSAIIGKNGSFEFKHEKLSTPTFFKLSLSSTSFITLIGDSTEQIVVEADTQRFTTEYKIKNSKESALVKTQSLRVMNLRST